jgi:hypothetical protein
LISQGGEAQQRVRFTMAEQTELETLRPDSRARMFCVRSGYDACSDHAEIGFVAEAQKRFRCADCGPSLSSCSRELRELACRNRRRQSRATADGILVRLRKKGALKALWLRGRRGKRLRALTVPRVWDSTARMTLRCYHARGSSYRENNCGIFSARKLIHVFRRWISHTALANTVSN